MTEIVQYQQPSSLGEQMDFARAVVQRPEGAAASLLPQAYRDNPGNVLLAVGLGSSMGLSPAESLYRIDVIQGKPTASAELIAANVRKAGHRLRVRGGTDSCTATIIRADDPDFEFTVTRDAEWARAMGLHGKDNYKKQPGTMLQWRAITAVARLACPEALYGVAYTSDEMWDENRSAERPAGGLGAALATTTAEQIHEEPEGRAAPGVARDDSEPPKLDGRSALAKRMHATFNNLGITDRDNRLTYASDVIGREIESSTDLTEAEASAVIDALEADREQPFQTPEQPATDGA